MMDVVGALKIYVVAMDKLLGNQKSMDTQYHRQPPMSIIGLIMDILLVTITHHDWTYLSIMEIREIGKSMLWAKMETVRKAPQLIT